MCQEGQHGCEGTQSSSEEDEEGKFLLWVNWDFMESWGENKKGTIRTQVRSTLGSLAPLDQWDGQDPGHPPAHTCLCYLYYLAASTKSKFSCSTSGRDTIGLAWGCHTFMCTIVFLSQKQIQNSKTQSKLQYTFLIGIPKSSMCTCVHVVLSYFYFTVVLNHYSKAIWVYLVFSWQSKDISDGCYPNRHSLKTSHIVLFNLQGRGSNFLGLSDTTVGNSWQ